MKKIIVGVLGAVAVLVGLIASYHGACNYLDSHVASAEEMQAVVGVLQQMQKSIEQNGDFDQRRELERQIRALELTYHDESEMPPAVKDALDKMRREHKKIGVKWGVE